MQYGRVLAMGLAWLVLGGCAKGDDGSDIGPDMSLPGIKVLEPRELAPRCERVDELGLAASAERTQALGSSSAEAHCVSLSGNLVAAIGDRACKLIEPQGFTFDGCADWYDCEGCVVELRQQLNEELELTGTSDDPACADLHAVYVLYPGLACE